MKLVSCYPADFLKFKVAFRYLQNMFTAHFGVTIQFGAGVRDGLFYFPSSPGRTWRSASQFSAYAGLLPGL